MPPIRKTFLESWSQLLGLNYMEIYKLAHQARELKIDKRIMRLFQHDEELASAFSEVGESMSDEELKTILLDALAKSPIKN